MNSAEIYFFNSTVRKTQSLIMSYRLKVSQRQKHLAPTKVTAWLQLDAHTDLYYFRTYSSKTTH